jgi:hypothetical protein
VKWICSASSVKFVGRERIVHRQNWSKGRIHEDGLVGGGERQSDAVMVPASSCQSSFVLLVHSISRRAVAGSKV